MASKKDKTVFYNGIAFAPVAARMSMVISAPAEMVWATVSKFGKQALWMGSVEGQHIFTELLGGHTVDYVGAVRVFGISDKLIFEQLTRLDHRKMIMAWQGISHPMNSNPFPASFLNFKGQYQLSRVHIPGRQTFMDWTMELLTEVHAVDYMQDSMNGIMRVGLLNLQVQLEHLHQLSWEIQMKLPILRSSLQPGPIRIGLLGDADLQKYLAAGAHPSASLEMQIKPPEMYGISRLPQPQSAAMLLHQQLRNDQSGVPNMMHAHQTYVPAPTQQSASILSAEKIDPTAFNLEQTVPLLHEAHTQKEILIRSYQAAQHQAGSGPSMLQPRLPTSHSMPSASSAQHTQQRSAPALHPDWQTGGLRQQQQLQQQQLQQQQLQQQQLHQQHQQQFQQQQLQQQQLQQQQARQPQQSLSSQQLYAQRQRSSVSQAASQHPVGDMFMAPPSAASLVSVASSGSMLSVLSPQPLTAQSFAGAQPSQLSRVSPQPFLSPAGPQPQVSSGISRVSSSSYISNSAAMESIPRNIGGGWSDVAKQMAVAGTLDNLSLADVPRNKLKRSAGSSLQQ